MSMSMVVNINVTIKRAAAVHVYITNVIFFM